MASNAKPRPLAAAVLAGLLLAGCSSGGGGGEGMGSSLRRMLVFGGSEPELAPAEPLAVAECPAVLVADGRAAVRAGEGAAVRSQISIVNVARECTGRPDGGTTVKVGVQGRALVGPGGGATSFNTPLTITLKRGDQVLASRTRQVSLAIGAGQPDATFTIVEDGLVAPPGIGEFDIEVGLGGAAPAARRTRARRQG